MITTHRSNRDSYLFLIRLWPEEITAGEIEWRAKVQHVRSGQARYLQQIPALVETLMSMLDCEGKEPEKC